MTLASGDLTTSANVIAWLGLSGTIPTPTQTLINQLIGRMTALIYNKLNRSRLFSQTFTRTFDGVGNMQLVLPDWPVTNISLVQQGLTAIPQRVLPAPSVAQPAGTSPCYGYSYVPWAGNLPGDPVVLEFVGGFFYTGAQNVKVTYTAGYLISSEAHNIPATPGPYAVTTTQPLGICCKDGGVVYAATGIALTPVATSPGVGQYIPPADTAPGVYTFSAADQGTAVLISYSFVPADLEEACIQMVAERYYYRSRVGEISKSLAGQETVRYQRGGVGRPYNTTSDLPPEVMDLIWPYVSVIPPAIGAPV